MQKLTAQLRSCAQSIL